ncbi:hypothetical protein L489_2828 [Bordetella bronchiseptica 00-P-2730]|nr:hypothetical protein L489_2828 [Bordetella bronchiseptica 00-P-2730]
MIGGLAGDVLGQLPMQESQRVGAGRADDAQAGQRRALRRTIGARGNRIVESVHGGILKGADDAHARTGVGRAASDKPR